MRFIVIPLRFDKYMLCVYSSFQIGLIHYVLLWHPNTIIFFIDTCYIRLEYSSIN